jgi:protein involved in plasmid replication-relaxation
VTIRFRSAAPAASADLRLLQPRDRALMRLINRSKAASTLQLAGISRAHLRKIQQRTRLLWRAGYLERTTLPPPYRGGSPLAYRLSPAARRRLGYRDRRTAGIAELQHRLDTLEAVCALARPHATTSHPVQAWLTESMARGQLGDAAQPDSLVVVQLPSGSAVLCLEIDEATQHAPVIRHKLLAYRKALGGRRGWHLLFVVPSEARRLWLLRQASADPALSGWVKGWVCEVPLLSAHGLETPAWSLRGLGALRPLRALVADPSPRRCPTPVGSRAWLDVLGTGGGEDLNEALR